MNVSRLCIRHFRTVLWGIVYLDFQHRLLKRLSVLLNELLQTSDTLLCFLLKFLPELVTFWARGSIALVVVLYLPQELVFLNHLPEQVETVVIVHAQRPPHLNTTPRRQLSLCDCQTTTTTNQLNPTAENLMPNTEMNT